MLKNATLFQQNKESVWHMYFYDDEDGGASFKSFMNTFTDKNWAVKEEDSLHVVIRSVNGNPL
jgi:nuclear transport factor 2 (NTF2) superfamily protein